ncbi:hypothetical protein [Cellulomonas sp.]|uniref:hypothetical protein n=1 Tax=Cellulomonas sp. TaxID=40001 RepID=UPI001B251665|nr:hypothetical protein [Cellulomonas sp.]MBO9556438.1 hypothetical protein [Cellulomonas sp.]
MPEGSTFLVPWRDVDRQDMPPGFLVVARRAPRTAAVAVYLFDHAPDGAGTGRPYPLPDPADAVARARMSGLRMIEGSWPTLGVHPDFRRDDWTFDEVAWRPYGGRQWVAIRLDDRNVLDEVGRREIDDDEALMLPSGDLEGDTWPALVLKEREEARVRRELDAPWSDRR